MEINYLAVLVATVMNMLVGYIWYSTSVFGKAWMQDVGKKSMELKSPGSGYGLMILASIIIALALAKVLGLTNTAGFVPGVGIGLLAGVGFVATTQAANFIFEGRPQRLYFINAGYPVVSMALMAGVIAAMR